MELAARAETWLRVQAAKFLGPGADGDDLVDPRGFLVLSCVAHGLGMLEVLDEWTTDAVFADLGVAAGARGRRVLPNEYRSVEGSARFAASPRGALTATSHWPPVTLSSGVCLEVDSAVVQLLWLTRTPTGTFAPARIRLPAAGTARPTAMARVVHVPGPVAVGPGVQITPPVLATPLGPGLPLIEVIDDSGAAHALNWSTAQSDGASTWGTVEIVPDLPRWASTVEYRIAGEESGEVVACVSPPAAPNGVVEDDPRTPAERYLDCTGDGPETRRLRAGDSAGLWEATRAAFCEIGLVNPSYVPAERPAQRGAGEARPDSLRPLAPAVPSLARPLGVRLSLERVSAYLEGLTVEGDRATIQVRLSHEVGPGSPPWWSATDHGGEPVPCRVFAPMGVQTFDVILDLGPAGPARPRQVRLVAQSPFDAAYVELEIPLS
jgi:hypothetical protein